jgi:hypothetical protein
MTQSRGISAGTSTVVVFPFTFKVNGIALTLWRKGHHLLFVLGERRRDAWGREDRMKCDPLY